MKFTKIAISVMITSIIWCGIVMAEVYRWEGKDGKTQYGDHVPVSDNDQGRIKYNEKSGRIIEEVPPAPTPQEQKRLDEQKRQAEIERKKKQQQEEYDRVLLSTFNSAQEIIDVRDERLSLIDESIKLSRSRLRKQEKELVKLNESRNRFINRDMQPPVWIGDTEAKVLKVIEGIERYISDKSLEKERLRRQFGKDLKRYKELTNRSLSAR